MIFFVAKPIYEELDGWSDTNDINFLKFISFIEEKKLKSILTTSHMVQKLKKCVLKIVLS